MWPWSRADKEPLEEDSYIVRHLEIQDLIFKHYPVGKEVKYLGVTLKVTHHLPFREGIMGLRHMVPPEEPKIRCAYVSGSGNIRKTVFDCEEILTWGSLT